jgi:transposase
MASGDVDGGAAPDLSAGGRGVSKRPQRCGVSAVGADDPAGPARRPTAQDRHACGDERLLYLLRTGCSWCYLPRDSSFPPRSTVCNIFCKFQRDGVWEAILAELQMALRERVGREASPSVAVLDSPSVKSAEKGSKDDRVGYDAGERVKGRKIHTWVDSEGLPMWVVVYYAAVQRSRRAGLVLDEIRRGFPWLELILADGGYNAWQVDAAVAKVPPLRVAIVKRSDDVKRSVVLPAAGWSSGPFPGSGATGGLPRISRTSPKPLPLSSPSLRSSSPSGGLPGRRPWPQHGCGQRAAVVGSVSRPCRRAQQ